MGVLKFAEADIDAEMANDEAAAEEGSTPSAGWHISPLWPTWPRVRLRAPP